MIISIMNILLELSNMYVKKNSRIQLILINKSRTWIFNSRLFIWFAIGRKNNFCENQITSTACRYLFWMFTLLLIDYVISGCFGNYVMNLQTPVAKRVKFWTIYIVNKHVATISYKLVKFSWLQHEMNGKRGWQVLAFKTEGARNNFWSLDLATT